MHSEEKHIDISPEIGRELLAYADMPGKSPSAIVEDALLAYFDAIGKELAQKSLSAESAQTNLSYDEFWDGVDI